VIPLLLFLGHMVFLLVFAVMYFGHAGSVELPEIMTPNNVTSAEVISLGFTSAGLSFAGALVLVALWLLLLFVNAYCMIVIGQLFMAVLLTIFGVILVYSATTYPGADAAISWILAIICFAGAVFTVAWIFCIRDRIEFTALLLKTVAIDLAAMPEIILISMGAACATYGYACVWYCATLEFNNVVLGSSGFQLSGSPNAGVYAGNAWMLLILFWGELVIMNVSFVTTCGAIGEAYFSGIDAVTAEGAVCCRPAAWSSLRRACTTSLGSIAFGSLLVAIIKTLKAMARSAQNNSRNGLVQLIMCCVVCLLSCIEGTLRWLTEWAYVYVAIYGTSFIESGSRVMDMLEHSGIDAIVTTVLVDPIITMASFCGLGAGIGLGVAAVQITGVHVWWLACVLGGIVGFAVVAVGLAPIYAGTKALFVCVAEEPFPLQKKAPELHNKMREMMPMGGAGGKV